MLQHVPIDLGYAVVGSSELPAGLRSMIEKNMGQALGRPACGKDRRFFDKYDHLLTILTLAAPRI
jgi:hypothetical protein